MNKTTGKVLDKMIDDTTADLAACRAENKRLRSVLEQIVGNSALVLNSQPGAEKQCLREILAIARAALAPAAKEPEQTCAKCGKVLTEHPTKHCHKFEKPLITPANWFSGDDD